MTKSENATRKELAHIKHLRNSSFKFIALFTLLLLLNFFGIQNFKILLIFTIPGIVYSFIMAMVNISKASKLLCPKCKRNFGIAKGGSIYFSNECENCGLSLKNTSPL